MHACPIAFHPQCISILLNSCTLTTTHIMRSMQLQRGSSAATNIVSRRTPVIKTGVVCKAAKQDKQFVDVAALAATVSAISIVFSPVAFADLNRYEADAGGELSLLFLDMERFVWQLCGPHTATATGAGGVSAAPVLMVRRVVFCASQQLPSCVVQAPLCIWATNWLSCRRDDCSVCGQLLLQASLA